MKKQAFQLAVVGGGVAGICFAVAAARQGVDTVLISDRPMLGGNASAEVGVAPSGAINFNAFTMETGILGDAMLKDREFNTRPMGETFSMTLSELVWKQDKLTLLENTRVTASQTEEDRIRSVTALGLMSGESLQIYADAFADCTGDAVLSRLCGAEVMYGRESRERFGEALAPEKEDSMVMGTTVLFSAERREKPVPFYPPVWAKHITEASMSPDVWLAPGGGDTYAGFWWLELGGPLHTVNDEQQIAHELYAWVYGLWDYLKNRSEYRGELENFELTRVSSVPGKRESYRVVGDVIVTEQDIRSGGKFYDAVATGGWYIDLHNPGAFADASGKTPFVYDFVDPAYQNYAYVAPFGLPLRAMYSREIANLWLGGRLISTSHVAFGATRVACTLGNAAQAAGIGAAYALKNGLSPREAAKPEHIAEIRRLVTESDVRVPDCHYAEESLAGATIIASSQRTLSAIAPGGEAVELDTPWGLTFPVTEPYLEEIRVPVRGTGTLRWSLSRIGDVWDRADGTELCCGLQPVNGEEAVTVSLQCETAPGCYRLSLEGKGLQWPKALQQPCGVVAQYRFSSEGRGVTPLSEAKIPSYTVWNCKRGSRFALAAEILPPQRPYGPENVRDGFCFQDAMPNLWLPEGDNPWLKITLPENRRLCGIRLTVDTDLNRNITQSVGRAPASPDWIEVLLDGTAVAAVEKPCGRTVELPFSPVTAQCIRIQTAGGTGGIYKVQLLEE